MLKPALSVLVSFRFSIPTSLQWLRNALAFVIFSLGILRSTDAHPADQSELRARPKAHQLELRFTFNILTLTRFTGIDTDDDGKISVEELQAAHPRIAAYLNQHVRIEINRQKAALGSVVRFENVWPEPEKTPPMTEVEYATRNVDVTFSQIIDGKRLEDFWLGFEIFEQTGPLQTIRGIYEQDGRVEEVPFSVNDPEYLYDTGYADDPFEKEADSKVAALAQAPSAPAAGTALAPAAKLAVGGMPPPNSPSPDLAAKPAPGLSNILETAVTSTGDQRWWMVRAVVLMVILVVGRKLQMSKRARISSTRRRPRTR